jgi:hypothetical protein
LLRHLTLALALCGLAHAPACAEEAPILAQYWTDSGSLPPEYAWETTVTIYDDGMLELTHCTGYETEGPACKHRRAQVAEDARQAIRDAAAESGLKDNPARESEYPMVGGGLTGGLVYVDGVKVKLLSQPADADVTRVGAVLKVIAQAIPTRFDRFLDPD